MKKNVPYIWGKQDKHLNKLSAIEIQLSNVF